MEISPEVLSEELDKEFDDYQVNLNSKDEIIVTDSHPAGMYFKDDFERFEEDLEEFILYHTKEWKIVHTSMNDIEGMSRAVITR